MIRAAVLGSFLVTFCPPAAVAGAWLRAPGSGFFSSSGTVTQARDVGGSLYAEYGLTGRLTLGVDVDGGMDRSGAASGDGVVFLRFPLSDTEAPHKWATHVGLGARYDTLEFYPAAELGLSWGRGFQWGERYGWTAIDTTFNVSRSPMEPITKLDATIGLDLGATTKVMAQAFFTRTQGSLYTTLAPSFLYTPKGTASTYQIGAEFPLQDDDDAKLKLAIWRTF